MYVTPRAQIFKENRNKSVYQVTLSTEWTTCRIEKRVVNSMSDIIIKYMINSYVSTTKEKKREIGSGTATKKVELPRSL